MGIPAGIKETISKTSEDEYQDQDRIRRMKSDYNIGNEMASWSNKCYSSLAEMNMNEIVQSSTCNIANERRQKYERDNEVSNAVVLFEL